MRRRALIALILPAAAAIAPAAEASPGCHSRRCFRHAAELCKRHPACRARVERRRAARAASTVSATDRAWLARVRDCESGGDYSTNTGNGFYGAYQFTLSSWASVGGRVRPDLAAPTEQDMRALRLRAMQGVGAWPVCG
jgi:hypothetical protein